MKKLITLTFALFLTAGLAFGQNNNEVAVNQSGGNDNHARIEQNADGTGLIQSTVNQVGSHNSAITYASRVNAVGSETSQKQIGDNNKARINLDDAPDADGNEGTTLTQYQKGNSNFASMEGQDSYSAEQRQIGNSNVALTSKNGKNGDVYQLQQGNDNRAVAEGLNFADADQRQYGDHNKSLLNNLNHNGPGESYTTYQDGDSNTLNLLAGSNGGVLDARQVGNSNVARVTWTTVGNTATINQSGNANDVIVNQN